ncbi:hypothetical protein NX021_11440, partial [Cytobacillus firmus]|nr:hypothetical protein [Cytobacillus firmus]
DPVELDYVLKALKSPQALYYFYFKTKKTADKHDFHRVCRQSERTLKVLFLAASSRIPDHRNPASVSTSL